MAYKYQVIGEQILEDALRSGNDRLPSEHEICQRYGVSRTTAIKALNSLRSDNLVRREVGRGTFVNRSQVKTRVSFLVNEHVPELVSFAREAVEMFGAANPYIDVRVKPIDSRDWINAIVNVSGPKVICSSHVGFLSDLALLQRLDHFDGFREVAGAINGDLIAWRTDRAGEVVCDSLPLYVSPDLLAFNRELAAQLKLDAEHGPRSWDDLREWTGRASKIRRGGRRVMGAHIKRDNLLPLSYYMTLAGGRHFIHEDRSGVTFDFSRGEEWLAFFRELYTTERMRDWPEEEPDPLLARRSLTSLIAAPWIINQARDVRMGDVIGLCPVPPATAGGSSFSHVGKGEIAIVGAADIEEREMDAAWRFVRFLMVEADAQRAMLRHWSSLATNREVYGQQQADPTWLPFVQAFATGRIRCDHPAQHYLMKIVYKYYYAAVIDGLDCATAARRIDEGCRLQLEIADEGIVRPGGN